MISPCFQPLEAALQPRTRALGHSDPQGNANEELDDREATRAVAQSGSRTLPEEPSETCQAETRRKWPVVSLLLFRERELQCLVRNSPRGALTAASPLTSSLCSGADRCGRVRGNVSYACGPGSAALRAEVVVSGDKAGVLALGNVEGIPTVTAREALGRLGLLDE